MKTIFTICIIEYLFQFSFIYYFDIIISFCFPLITFQVFLSISLCHSHLIFLHNISNLSFPILAIRSRYNNLCCPSREARRAPEWIFSRTTIKWNTCRARVVPASYRCYHKLFPLFKENVSWNYFTA